MQMHLRPFSFYVIWVSFRREMALTGVGWFLPKIWLEMSVNIVSGELASKEVKILIPEVHTQKEISLPGPINDLWLE